MTIIHNKIYECDEFTFYLEIWEGLPVLHMRLRKFSHNIFKKQCKIVKNLAQYLSGIYAYSEEDSTDRLLRMAGFKDTDITIWNSNGFVRRLLCLQQQ